MLSFIFFGMTPFGEIYFLKQSNEANLTTAVNWTFFSCIDDYVIQILKTINKLALTN